MSERGNEKPAPAGAPRHPEADAILARPSTWEKTKRPGEIIPPKEMIRLYPGYHTLDPDMAAEKITEIYHLGGQSQARPA